jgi:hypothetical protein
MRVPNHWLDQPAASFGWTDEAAAGQPLRSAYLAQHLKFRMSGDGRTNKRLKRLNGETDLKVGSYPQNSTGGKLWITRNGTNGVKMKSQWTPNHWVERPLILGVRAIRPNHDGETAFLDHN